jgi:HEXXH motif-containing protein
LLAANSKSGVGAYRAELLRRAAALIPRDLVQTIAPWPGLMVLLEDKRFEAGNNSYTLSDIYGTIYLDVNSSLLRTAETMFHESSHLWLTETLAAYRIGLDPERSYFSPWKGQERPAFGMLHAITIFGLLAIFFRRMSDHPTLTPDERRYCVVRRRLERKNLRGCGAALEEICAQQIRNEVVSKPLLDIYHAALA